MSAVEPDPDMPQMLHAPECECEECREADAAERERRTAAALNATKDFTTIGLEEIAAKGKTLQLALLASQIVKAEDVSLYALTALTANLARPKGENNA